MRDIATKFTGDSYSAAEFNSSQVELENIVTDAGLSLDPAGGPDTKQHQLGQASAAYSCGGNVLGAAGTVNDIVLNTTSNLQAPSAYIDNMMISFKPTGANTGAVTATILGLTPKKVLSYSGIDLVAGEIQDDIYTKIVYDTSLESGAGAFVLVPYPTNTVRVTYEEVSAGGGGYGDLLQRTGAGTSTADTWVARRLSNVYGSTNLVTLSKYDPGDTYYTVMELTAGVYDFSLSFAMRETQYTAVRIVDTPFSTVFFQRAASRFAESDGVPTNHEMVVHGTLVLASDKNLQIQMACSVARTNSDAFGDPVAATGRLDPAATFGPNVYCELQLVRRNYRTA